MNVVELSQVETEECCICHRQCLPASHDNYGGTKAYYCVNCPPMLTESEWLAEYGPALQEQPDQAS